MKKVLLIVAMLFAAIVANAQEKESNIKIDTLSYQQLTADYVSLNKQIMEFKKLEITAMGIGATAGVLAIVSTQIMDTSTKKSKVLLVASGVAAIGSMACYFIGLDKLKRDNLEITPEGVVIKLSHKE